MCSKQAKLQKNPLNPVLQQLVHPTAVSLKHKFRGHFQILSWSRVSTSDEDHVCFLLRRTVQRVQNYVLEQRPFWAVPNVWYLSNNNFCGVHSHSNQRLSDIADSSKYSSYSTVDSSKLIGFQLFSLWIKLWHKVVIPENKQLFQTCSRTTLYRNSTTTLENQWL